MRGARNRIVAFAATMALVLPLWVGGGTAQGGVPSHPTRVLIVLFDQMIPQYANQFDMPNFRELRNEGTNFRNAYLGYMASETVIAHNVITSGQLPKHMGWVDEAYRDADNLLGKGAGAMHITGDLSSADFGTLINASYNGAGYPKLADYLQTADPGSKFIVVGEKSYAVESATAPNGAIGVRMSSRVRLRKRVRTSIPAAPRSAAATGSRSARTCRATSATTARRCGTSTPTPATATAPRRRSPRGCIRKTATGSSPAPTPPHGRAHGW